MGAVTVPEVTREEAEYLTDASSALTRRLARTVVALYDALDAALSDKIQVAIDTTPLIPPPGPVDPAVREQVTDRLVAGLTNERAMRECIDRLRDGWDAGEFTGRQGTPTGWYWRKPSDVGSWGDVYEYAFEPMTPEQQAVMAR